MKRIQDCSVNQIRMLNDDTYILKLTLPVVPEKIKAGNFAEVRVDNTADVFLRRPFSIYDVDYKAKTISFFIKNIGKGTELLSKMKVGENVNIIYPLGNSFSENKKGKVLLIGGGSGVVRKPCPLTPDYLLVKSVHLGDCVSVSGAIYF